MGTKKAKGSAKRKKNTAQAPQNAALPKNIPAPKDFERTLLGKDRKHIESLAPAWIAVSGIRPDILIPQVVQRVLYEGGTRPSWQWTSKDLDYVFMAWPKESPLRVSVLVRGEKESSLRPVTCVPLLEGVPNDLCVETVHPWEEGCGATVGCDVIGAEQPMWFYDPFYVRDKDDLTAGVTHTFLLAALAFGLRRALLDEITITQGPAYEAYAAKWLENNPEASRIDIPPLKLDVAGKKIIHPGAVFSEYQIRTVVDDIDKCELNSVPVTILYTHFPMEGRAPLALPIYASSHVLGSYEPKVGDEIDAYVWFQGRVIDYEPDTDSKD